MPRRAAPRPAGAPPKKPDVRARRVIEIGQLKIENARLKEEREQLKDTVTSLSQLVEGEPADEVAQENRLLRQQLEEHQQFIHSLHAVLDNEHAIATQHRATLYEQGAQTARSFVLSLLAESAKWPAAQVPSDFSMPLPLVDFRCTIQPDAEQGLRLSLRLDVRIPFSTDPDVVANLLFETFRSEKLSQRVQQASVDVKLTSVDAPSNDTELVLFRHGSEKETLFILNRRRVQMGLTTLSASNAGLVDVNLVAMSSTAMLKEESIKSAINVDLDETVRGLSSVVIKGAAAWKEDDVVRLAVVYSCPDDYNIVEDLSFGDIMDKNSGAVPQMSEKFARVLATVFNEFQAWWSEKTQGL